MQNLLQNLHTYYFPFKSLRWHIYSRVYVFVQGFAVINYWRGVWTLWDIHTTKSLASSFISIAIGTLGLCLFQASKNARVVPVVIRRDYGENVFQYLTRFRVNSETCTVAYVCDVLFTYVILHSFVTTFWRGTWTLMNNILCAESRTHSLMASLILGYGLIIIEYVLQFPMAKLSRKIGGKAPWFLQLLFEDVYIFVSNIANVNIWRGLWLTYDAYILPNSLNVSSLTTFAVGIVLLYAIRASICIGGIQWMIDGTPTDGSGLYATHFFELLNTINEVNDDTKMTSENLPSETKGAHKENNQVSNKCPESTTIPRYGLVQ
ncbi:uncharacterized protein LOC144348140 [Saccoglossus kowalevskii]